jgi:predicted DNA repair protein MutK
VTGEGASAAVSWLVMAFLDAVFGFLLGSILIPIVNVLPEK